MIRCSGCGKQLALQELIDSPEIEPIGMQLDDTNLKFNYYYFNHNDPSCGSTLLVPITEFIPLIHEPIPGSIAAGEEGCGRHCLDVQDLSNCTNECHHAPFRRFLLEMIERKSKNPTPQ